MLDRLTGAFDALSALYIADGHHRSAAASRVAAARRAANPKHTGTESYNYFLAVALPHHQMRILPYNRMVTDLNGLSRQELVSRLGRSFAIHAANAAVMPGKPGEFGLYLFGQWYRLNIHPATGFHAGSGGTARCQPACRSCAESDTWQSLIHVATSASASSAAFAALRELEKRVDSGEMAVAFSLIPTRMEDLMAVADAGEAMPPKSTWFEPKLADGLVSHVLD